MENPKGKLRVVRPGEAPSESKPTPTQDLLETAKDLLRRIQAGEIQSLGFVAINQEGHFVTSVTGNFLVDDSGLYKGLDVLKNRLIRHFEQTFDWGD